MPAWRLLRWILHQAGKDAGVALHVRLNKSNQRISFISQLTKHRIHNLDIRAVAVHEDDSVETMVNETTCHVIHQII